MSSRMNAARRRAAAGVGNVSACSSSQSANTSRGVSSAGCAQMAASRAVWSDMGGAVGWVGEMYTPSGME
jgi:hypothetical protein